MIALWRRSLRGTLLLASIVVELTMLALPLASRDYATLRDILDGWRKAEDVLYLVVTDPRGRVLAASRHATNEPLPAPGPAEGNTRHARFTVNYMGQDYGHVQYGLSTRYIDDAKSQLPTQSSLIALTEIVATLLLLSAIGYWLTRHLAALTRASARVAEGDYDTRLKVQSQDEIGRLAERFNLMAAAAQGRIAALSASEQRSRAIADHTYDWENWFAPDGRLL